ncbi:MAG: histidine kinase [Nitrospirales bacterium]|nr:MAG: histidine kinase [Nitrospirales bacterium]
MPMTNTSSVNNTTALVGRQPIYGSRVDVFAYELLYRGGGANQANFVDGDAATANVMLNAMLEIGLEPIVGNRLAFINITANLILGQLCQTLPKEQVVLEILEDVEPTEPIIEALTELAKQGYTIALDDFIYHDSLQPLVDIAHIVKVDVMALSREEIEEHVLWLRQHPLKLLAEKVETHEDFEFCQGLGFDYFQGYFFCKPNVIAGAKVPANRMAILMLLAKLQERDIEITQIEKEIKSDVSLSYKLLRYVNSAYCGLPRKVDSIAQAACMVGIDKLRMWVTLMSLASMEEKPFELLVTATVRASMCEQLGRALQQDAVDQFFTIGLFSVLDGFFDCELSEVLDSLPLSPEVKGALLERTGLLGQVLDCVIAFEQGKWQDVSCVHIDPSVLQNAYIEAIGWSTQILSSMRG